MAITAPLIALLYGLKVGNIKTGFGPDETITKSEKRDKKGKVTEANTTTTFQDAKTLWDWLSLLGVPFSLAILGYLLQQLQQTRLEQQTKTEKEIAESNQREEALQNYLDRISELVIDKNILGTVDEVHKRIEEGVVFVEMHDQEISLPVELHEPTGKEINLVNAAAHVIRARTLSILRRLGQDGERKGHVIRFLVEAEVVSKFKLDLSNVDLRGARLSSITLNNTNLSMAELNGAYLSGANLSGANLSVANLTNAEIIATNLSGANLRAANLTNAKLNGANLKGTCLDYADLSSADISLAREWTEAQLGAAKLCRTKLPDGCNLEQDRDCEV